ncbi:MAG: hypothetical protein MO853_06690 [Candidatus Protistobacter heckmanni]|nr:hypothetical protein [Candidatus Protistobacter heckmanni]
MMLKEPWSLGSSAADPRTPVCLDADGVVLNRADMAARVRAAAAALSALPARRRMLALEDPFDFVCALHAAAASGKEALIPGNFQGGLLADLSREGELLRDLDVL